VKTQTNVFTNPLAWWASEDGGRNFGILARLARKYLAVQATSAPSEQVFSLAGHIITKLRNRLDPAVAGAQLYTAVHWDSDYTAQHLALLAEEAEDDEDDDNDGSGGAVDLT
jgi:hypothetical protein